MSIIWDIWNTIHAIVTSSSMVMLIIGAVIILGAAFMMQSLESLATTTLVALIAFALIGYVYAVTVLKQPAAAFATADWHNFTTMNGLTLLAYGLIFGAGIAVANVVFSVVRR